MNTRTVLASLLLAMPIAAQQPPPAPAPATARPADHNGAAKRATHRPDATLRPLIAWEFVKAGNARYVQRRKRAARTNGTRAPGTPTTHGQTKPLTRPAFAGRYICAVLLCSDNDVDIAATLGLDRQDVLVVQTPGPFASPETVALLERMVRKERLSLVLVIGHESCSSLTLPAGQQTDALSRRVRTVRALAARRGQQTAVTLTHLQRERLLGSSRQLATAQHDDRLRIMPGMLNPHSGQITWHVRPANALAIPPVMGKDSRR